ncbi:efflux RND transporter periplasmic adaptor subunit [Rhizobium lusitanum]|uniref:efflux RND transporter periplasmic adaptor subunit n=1 Tax=Rhizobium lusitanum TaxID=293958 RepID=UPI0032B1E2AD
MIAGSIIWWWSSVEKQAASAAKATNALPIKVPVTAAKVVTADVPIYLNGLGTVAPYQTVVVSSRVDGEIIKVGFKQGQMVAKGDLLFNIDPRPYQAALDAAEAKKAQDQASQTEAELNLKRITDLSGKGADSKQQLDTQQATVDQLAAMIKGDQAQIDSSQLQLHYTTIRAPITGRAGFRLVDVGNIVHAANATSMVAIDQLQPISVVFTAPEEDIGRIYTALAAGDVPVLAESSDGLKTLSKGRLAIVNNAVDATSGSISLKATFTNADNVLSPGLSISTRLLVETLRQVTVIPHGAIQNGPDGLYAYVIGADDKVAMVAITIGSDSDGTAVVLTGLHSGEVVVTSGQYRLGPGTLVDGTLPANQVAPAAKVP